MYAPVGPVRVGLELVEKLKLVLDSLVALIEKLFILLKYELLEIVHVLPGKLLVLL